MNNRNTIQFNGGEQLAGYGDNDPGWDRLIADVGDPDLRLPCAEDGDRDARDAREPTRADVERMNESPERWGFENQ